MIAAVKKRLVEVADRNCSVCSFWMPTPGGLKGECRRFPPLSGSSSAITANDFVCGEFLGFVEVEEGGA